MVTVIEQFDDPLNPHSWALEPRIRRLRVAFPDLGWEFHPCGFLESWDAYDGPEIPHGRAGMASTCAQISEASAMPIDEYLWFSDPPSSSLPACRRIAAAYLQGRAEGARLVRALQEATFVRRVNVSDDEQLRATTESVRGVDVEALREALADGTGAAAVERHRERMRDEDVPGVTRAGRRYELPTIVVRNGGDARGVSGRKSFETYVDLVADVADASPREDRPTVEQVIDRFSPEGWLSLAELSELTGTPQAEANERAAELVDEEAVSERTFASEPFWRDAAFATSDE